MRKLLTVLASFLLVTVSQADPVVASETPWTRWVVQLSDGNNQPISEARERNTSYLPDETGEAATKFVAQYHNVSFYMTLKVSFTWTNLITGQAYPVGGEVELQPGGTAEARHIEVGRAGSRIRWHWAFTVEWPKSNL
jgi:hypothetical protein